MGSSSIANDWCSETITLYDFYFRTMEDLIEAGQTHMVEKCGHVLNESSFGLADLDKLNPAWTKIYPRYLRYSFLALAVARFEDSLRRLCGNLGGELRELRRLDQMKAFLKNRLNHKPTTLSGETTWGEHLSKNENWDDVTALAKFRHCILHCSGRVSESRDQEAIRRDVKCWDGAAIADDLLVFDREFFARCRQATVDFFNTFDPIVQEHLNEEKE